MLLRIVVLSVLIHFINNPGFCQSILTENNQWNIVQYPTFSPDYSSYAYRIGEEIEIDSFSYRTVLYSGDSLQSNWTESNYFLREDTLNRVFLKQGLNGNNEFLLYEFSLQLHDSIVFDEEYCILKVINIDSIQLNNGEWRKRWELMKSSPISWPNQYWIEGIGSNYGLLNHFEYCYLDYSEALLCHFNNGELLFPESPPSCFLSETHKSDLSGLEIYPNPFVDFITIESDLANNLQYTIYDWKGKLFYTSFIDDPKKEISLAHLSSGIYLLQVINESGERQHFKIIKI